MESERLFEGCDVAIRVDARRVGQRSVDVEHDQRTTHQPAKLTPTVPSGPKRTSTSSPAATGAGFTHVPVRIQSPARSSWPYCDRIVATRATSAPRSAIRRA